MKKINKTRAFHVSKHLRYLSMSVIIVAGCYSSTAIAQQQNEIIVDEGHGDWRVTCSKVKSDQVETTQCVMSQTQKRKDSEKVLLGVQIQPMAGEKISGRIRLPLGVSLKDGVTLRVDDEEPFAALAYRTCLPHGCIVPFQFDSDTVKRLKDGGGLKLSLVSVNNKRFGFAVSLKGFTAAYNRVKGLMGIE
jgi:invasion protein IalB